MGFRLGQPFTLIPDPTTGARSTTQITSVHLEDSLYEQVEGLLFI